MSARHTLSTPREEKQAATIPFALPRIFASEGPLAQALPGYAPRPQQLEMAVAVQRALEDQQSLIVEAGTGIGKSLAYLIPCALWALQHRKKVVVATYTRALQEQLMVKDLPIVANVLHKLGLTIQYALLMGAENYLCVQRLTHGVKQGEALFDTDGEEQILGKLHAWTRTAMTGLRSRVPFRVPESVWGRVCRDADLCLGRRGPTWPACLYRKDVARVRQAGLVVVNQHMLLAGLPLSAVDALVIDEAHNLEAVASQFLGFVLSNQGLKRLLDDLANPQTRGGLVSRLGQQPEPWRKEVEVVVDTVHVAAGRFFEQIRSMLNNASGRAGNGSGLVPTAEETSATGSMLTQRITQPRVLPDTLSEPLGRLAALLEEALASSDTAEQEADIRAHVTRCHQMAGHIQEFLACGSDEHAYWLAYRPASKQSLTSLHMAPLEVAELVRATLAPSKRPIILTSATLAVDGSLTSMKSRLGVDVAREVLLDSPFNYATQAAIYIDPTVPDPGRTPQAYVRVVIERCVEITRLVPGGTFILFTNRQLLEQAHQRFMDARLGRPIFRQADAPPHLLLDTFRRSGDGVLLGTETFWQGVDVPGPALSCVIITKLPFPVPDSPLEAARQERLIAQGKDAFLEYMLPKAVIKFRQGFGRLIRSAHDGG